MLRYVAEPVVGGDQRFLALGVSIIASYFARVLNHWLVMHLIQHNADMISDRSRASSNYQNGDTCNVGSRRRAFL